MQALSELQPAAAAAFEQAIEEAWTASDSALLGLCDRRIASLLGNDRGRDPERDDAQLSARELAHLAFTEQFVTAVSSVSDADVDALLAHEEPEQVFAFVAALHVLEMAQRLEMTTRAVL
jgi:hypothetical protein